MTPSTPAPPSTPNANTKRTLMIAGVVALAVALIGGGVTAVVLANRPAPVPKAASVVPPVTASQTASASVGATASVPTTTTSSVTTVATGASSNSAAPDVSSPRSTPPSRGELSTLKTGEWRVYGAKVVSAGTELKGNGSTDVQAIAVDCEAMTKSGNGYAHARLRLSFTASGPAPGKSGAWRLFGSWVIIPDDGKSDSQHYGQGVEGSLSGRCDVRPPAQTGKLVAGFNPIGAYRPKSGGVIESGRFTGNGLFEGVLSLPSVAVPPPTSN